MASAARGRLGKTLRGGAEPASSTERTVRMDALTLDVEGFGRAKFPVTPAKARKLITLGKPARFGRGEDTLTDPEVPDTWEIQAGLVRATWDPAVLVRPGPASLGPGNGTGGVGKQMAARHLHDPARQRPQRGGAAIARPGVGSGPAGCRYGARVVITQLPGQEPRRAGQAAHRAADHGRGHGIRQHTNLGTISGYIRQLEGDPVATLEIAVLRAAGDLRAEAAPSAGPSPDEAEFRDLAADCAARLRGQLDRPQREPGDWSVTLPGGGCTCDMCATLREFLAAPDQRMLEWPLAKQRRQHIHTRIDAAEAPVTHVTKRRGSPYVLVLRKTDDLFVGEQKARGQAASDLKWLANEWDVAI